MINILKDYRNVSWRKYVGSFVATFALLLQKTGFPGCVARKINDFNGMEVAQ